MARAKPDSSEMDSLNVKETGAGRLSSCSDLLFVCLLAGDYHGYVDNMFVFNICRASINGLQAGFMRSLTLHPS